jgi:hypothetical protein
MAPRKILKRMPDKYGEPLTAVFTVMEQTMKTFEFSIIASGLDHQADDFEQRFYDAGCDDATISFQKGHIIVDFAREAPSVEDAISSAIEAVHSTGASITRIEPDPLVNLSEIAARSGMTRQAIALYSTGQRGRGFPLPVARITTDNSLWDWPSVASWLYKTRRIPKDAVIEAEIINEANKIVATGDRDIVARLHRKTRELEAVL